MKKTLLASAVLFAFTAHALAAGNEFADGKEVTLTDYNGKKGLVKTVVGQEELADTTALTLAALGI